MSQRTPSPRWLVAAGLALATLGLAAFPAVAAPFWFVDTVTPYGDQVNWLYQFMMWISIAILVVVEVALVAAIIKFRKRPNEVREPETWSHNTTLEVVWTVIPFLILVAILVPTFQALAYFADVPKNPKLTLEVIGHQYYWEYRYPDLGATYTSKQRDENGSFGDPLLIPVGEKIKVVLTSADVIHSWWVPAFGVQQMTTPGNLAMMPLEIMADKTGKYSGACAFLCGKFHGAMGIYIEAVDRPTFDTWAAAHKIAEGATLKPIAQIGQVGQTPPPPQANEVPEGQENPQGTEAAAAGAPTEAEAKELAKKGEALYAASCAGCHQANGAGMTGVFPPLDGSEFVTATEPKDDKQLVEIIVKGLSGQIKVKGADYSSMMPPVGANLSDEEVAQIASYVRRAWSNKGKAIGPAQVKQYRK